jgi:flagellar biosynthesis protein
MTNPRAVAMAYGGEGAPRVIAKGQNELADKIIEEAKKAGIPVAESPELVNLLMGIDLEREIPPELYWTVAQILVWAYEIKPKTIQSV